MFNIQPENKGYSLCDLKINYINVLDANKKIK